jgi:hypothetical protein
MPQFFRIYLWGFWLDDFAAIDFGLGTPWKVKIMRLLGRRMALRRTAEHKFVKMTRVYVVENLDNH